MLFFFLQGYITHSNRISLHRAKFLANKFRISDLVYPLFEDNPRKYVYPTTTASPPYEPSSSSSSSPFTNKRSSLPSILDTGKITFSTTTPFQWLTHFYSCIPPLIACRLVTNHLMEKNMDHSTWIFYRYQVFEWQQQITHFHSSSSPCLATTKQFSLSQLQLSGTKTTHGPVSCITSITPSGKYPICYYYKPWSTSKMSVACVHWYILITLQTKPSSIQPPVINDNLPKDPVQPSTCANERERRSYGDAW